MPRLRRVGARARAARGALVTRAAFRALAARCLAANPPGAWATCPCCDNEPTDAPCQRCEGEGRVWEAPEARDDGEATDLVSSDRMVAA